MHHPIDRIVHTMAFVTSVVEHWQKEKQLNGFTMRDRSNNLSQDELMLYHGAMSRSSFSFYVIILILCHHSHSMSSFSFYVIILILW